MKGYERRFVLRQAGGTMYEVWDQEREETVCLCFSEMAADKVCDALNANVYPGDPADWGHS